jgi:UDP-N-acetylmuramoyl-L-alanyl-D-glutamate--2,6-diaminopimelate ligase
MRLSDLVQGLGISGEIADLEIGGIQYDSRRVAPGDLFVVWTGQRSDGRVHAAQAVANGAVAVLASGPPLAAADAGTPWLLAADPRALLGPLAARLYGHPDRELVLAGVTGTNGKGTTATVLARVLEAAGRPCGFLGSYGYSFGGQAYRGDRTTPEGSDLFRLLREMRQAGAQGVSMEVSSHALVQGRLDGAAFDVAVFLNLTRDHFDFHTDFEDYFAAKRRLFDKLKPGGRAVANADDPYGARLLAEIPGALGFGESAAVRSREVVLDTRGVGGGGCTPRGAVSVE